MTAGFRPAVTPWFKARESPFVVVGPHSHRAFTVCSLHLQIRPFAESKQQTLLLWPLLTSPVRSRAVTRAAVPPDRAGDLLR
jgi:hypothetical protein